MNNKECRNGERRRSWKNDDFKAPNPFQVVKFLQMFKNANNFIRSGLRPSGVVDVLFMVVIFYCSRLEPGVKQTKTKITG